MSIFKTRKKRANEESYFVRHLVAFLFFCLVCVVVFFTFLAIKKEYQNQLTLPVEVILLNQNEITQTQDIEAIFEQNSLSNHDVDFLKVLVLSLPWVKEASIHKEWPNRITIEVEEYKPKYLWQDLLYLDEKGTIFSIPENRIIPNPSLIHLYGEEGQEREIVKTIENFNEKIERVASNKITFTILAAEVNRRGAWQLLMQYCAKSVCPATPTVKVNLGKENILQRFDNLVYYLPEVIKKLKLKDRIITADLRNDNGIIIKTEVVEE